MAGIGVHSVNARLLIDAMVRRATVLVAQIATSGGLRAPSRTLRTRSFSIRRASSRRRESAARSVQTCSEWRSERASAK